MKLAFATTKTLALGAFGGAIFSMLGIPMPWMLGALASCMIASQFVADIHVPDQFRSVLQPVLGVMLGSFFTPSLLNDLWRWPTVLAFLALYIVVSTVFGLLYFRRVASYDVTTSFFAAVPGGLADLTLIGSSMGANLVLLGLIHSIRVVFVIVTMPFLLSYFAGPISVISSNQAPEIAGFLDLGILALCGIAGYALARTLRIPAGLTLAPLLISAIVHILGFTESSPPAPLVSLVQVVLGAYVGARFADLKWRQFRSALMHGLIWATGLVVISIAAALACSAATGFGLPQLLLAFAPGGIAEMGLLTIAFGIDVALVATCHAARIIFVFLIVPIAARRAPKRNEDRRHQAGLTDD